jgi:hypothetical protein
VTATKPTRGELRAQRREQRLTTFWSERSGQASTPADEAALAYQWVRGRIRKLPKSEQDAAWRALTAHLDAFTRPGNSHANFARPRTEIPRPTHTDAARPRARAREAYTT